MQLINQVHLLLLCAALVIASAKYATAQAAVPDFRVVTVTPSCAANTVALKLPSHNICAMECLQQSSCLSFSHTNETCVLSDSPYRTTSDAATVFRRRVSGYEQQIGGRLFWVFQQRQTGGVRFNRTWDEYERGFGDASEFWSGLQQIRSFAPASCNRTLRMEMTSHLDGVLHVAEWLNFTVSDASSNYAVNCGSLSLNSGFSGDPMYNHRGMKFSTIDRDNDINAAASCSQLYGNGGFWFHNCVNMNPNGWYSLVDHSADSGNAKFGYAGTFAIGDSKPIREIRMMLQL